eukprot:1498991-Rhodomonas_salina.1
MFIVVHGELDVYIDDRMVVTPKGEGKILGEMSVIYSEPRSLSGLWRSVDDTCLDHDPGLADPCLAWMPLAQVAHNGAHTASAIYCSVDDTGLDWLMPSTLSSAIYAAVDVV